MLVGILRWLWRLVLRLLHWLWSGWRLLGLAGIAKLLRIGLRRIAGLRGGSVRLLLRLRSGLGLWLYWWSGLGLLNWLLWLGTGWSLSGLGSGLLAGGQNLRSGLSDFGFELIEFLLDDFLVIREVGFQPFESAGIVFGFKIALEFIELLIAHLVSQADTDSHLQRFVNMLQKAVFLGCWQAAQANVY